MSRKVGPWALALLLTTATANAQQQQGGSPALKNDPRVLTEAEYGRIETLGPSTLSPDGKWVAYEIRRGVTAPPEFHYRAIASDSERTISHATSAAFTSNSRWLVYIIPPDTARRATVGARDTAGGGGGGGGGAPGRGTPASSGDRRNKVGMIDLRTGTTTVFADIQSFALSNDGVHVALRRYAPPGRASRGADLVVRDLAQSMDLTFGNVADFAWSDDGALLAMTIDVDGKTGNGLQLLNVATGALRSLDAADASYGSVAWRKRGDDLAVLRSRSDSTFADTSYVILAWRGLGTARPTRQLYDFTSDRAFPAGMRVANYRAPLWAQDGGTVFVGIAPRDPKPAAARGDSMQPARVEVWHWKDRREYHQQDRQAQQDRQKTHLSAWHLGDNRFVRLADDSLENVQLSENQRVAIATDDRPYFKEIISGRQYRDVYRIDVATGKREKIATKVASTATLSPEGRYVLYAQGGRWWSHDLRTGARTDLTSKTNGVFMNAEDDHPVPERRPYGVGGWTIGDKAVVLYDRYDLWLARPDAASTVRLTRGREDSTVYRVERLDPDTSAIDPAKPIVLSTTGEWSKRSGYARLTIGHEPQRLLWLDKSVSRLQRAKNADVFAYVVQSYDDSPDLLVGGPALADARQVSHTNAFLAGYRWGKQELREYTNSRGDKLQMMLTYPADYKPGKKYPMVVYYYEKLSQGYHQWVVPSERATYNTTVFSLNGYFVLRPDIVFRARDPGWSGLDCVTSAVKAVLATGMIDPKRVGNMGHSWGGYQSAFYAVHGHGLFAATIAGAPLTNFVSMYGYTSFNTGLPETGHFETGQERMEVPLWEDPQAYIRNSTVFAVDSLETPLLLEEGDADGNVNYWQSMELYNFGRRLGKHVVFLLYNDENHGVARPESQADYHRRQLEWFNHYLKGDPAPEWITSGESYLTRQKLLKRYQPPSDR